ncbi:MAG: helix-turn-helix transcriptional regulator [Deltaproteobacteria bacterium]|nr:helix-turn-helix transcriptional regulator [Deltaproteobacteria bacterium]
MNRLEIRRASDLADFLAAPMNAVLEGSSYTFYNLGQLCGWRVWGQPSREEAQQLVAAIGTAYAPGAPPYHSLVDLRHLERVDGAGFEILLRFVEQHRARMATQLVRQAVVRPAGMMGALASGFYVQLVPRHRVQVFDTLKQAARWLSPPGRASLAWLVKALEAQPEPTLSLQLRRWLATNLAAPSPRHAARALGVSLRTLQRRLHASGSSFQAELRVARVQHAQKLLLESTLKLAAVAQESGFSSSQQLATAFAAELRTTPSAFRKRYASAGLLKAPR